MAKFTFWSVTLEDELKNKFIYFSDGDDDDEWDDDMPMGEDDDEWDEDDEDYEGDEDEN